MIAGPVQTALFILCAFLSVALVAALFLRSALSYVRWFVITALVAAMTQDVLGLCFLPRDNGLAWSGGFLAAELAQALAWLLFSRRYARSSDTPGTSTPNWIVVILLSVLIGALAAPSGILATQRSTLSIQQYILTWPGFAVRVMTLILQIMTLTSLETTLVNSVHGQRWRIKFTLLGVFSLLTAQAFTVSLGLLYRCIDLSMAPARQTGFILGLAFLLYSSLFRGGESPVKVSKRLARSSVVLFAAGAYLLFLGALGFIMSITGYSGNSALMLSGGIVIGTGLTAVLLSEKIRRKCNRIIQNYFYKEKYDYRLQWLQFTKRITQSTTKDGLRKAVLLGFCETFGMGGAVLYLKDGNKPLLLPVQTWEVDSTVPALTRYEAIAEFAKAGIPAVAIKDIEQNFDVESSEFFRQKRAAFAVPLSREGALDGVVLLLSPIDSTEQYNQEDFDLMEALATQAHSALLNLLLSDQLAKSRDMEVMGKVSTFIVHDLKNLVYTLSLIVENAKKYIQNPEFQSDMLRGLENTVSKMHMLISQLRQLPSRENLRLESVNLLQLARDTFKHTPVEHLEYLGDAAMADLDKEQMRKVILNLVLNARDASSNGSPVVIETGHDNGVFLKVTDTGCGMSARFIIEDLFQPFKTTKAKGMGIGLYQCKQIVEAHGGTIEVDSIEGRGTTFAVRLPSPDGQIFPEEA